MSIAAVDEASQCFCHVEGVVLVQSTHFLPHDKTIDFLHQANEWMLIHRSCQAFCYMHALCRTSDGNTQQLRSEAHETARGHNVATVMGCKGQGMSVPVQPKVGEAMT